MGDGGWGCFAAPAASVFAHRVATGGAAPPTGAVHPGLGSHPFRCRWASGEDLFHFYPPRAGQVISWVTGLCFDRQPNKSRLLSGEGPPRRVYKPGENTLLHFAPEQQRAANGSGIHISAPRRL